MDDLVPNINRRAELRNRALDDLDRTVYTCAESAAGPAKFV